MHQIRGSMCRGQNFARGHGSLNGNPHHDSPWLAQIPMGLTHLKWSLEKMAHNKLAASPQGTSRVLLPAGHHRISRVQ